MTQVPSPSSDRTGIQRKKFVNSETIASESLGSLADVAPTLLEIMGIPKPNEMTGKSLLDGLI